MDFGGGGLKVPNQCLSDTWAILEDTQPSRVGNLMNKYLLQMIKCYSGPAVLRAHVVLRDPCNAGIRLWPCASTAYTPVFWAISSALVICSQTPSNATIQFWFNLGPHWSDRILLQTPWSPFQLDGWFTCTFKFEKHCSICLFVSAFNVSLYYLLLHQYWLLHRRSLSCLYPINLIYSFSSLFYLVPLLIHFNDSLDPPSQLICPALTFTFSSFIVTITMWKIWNLVKSNSIPIS